MILLQGGHTGELKEALSAGLPVYFVAVAISLLLVVLADSPEALPASFFEFVATRRRELALVGSAVGVSAAVPRRRFLDALG